MAALPPLTRRGLLTAAALGSLAACGADEQPAAGPTTRRVAYGTDHPDQFGVLAMPGSEPRGVVVLVHGGFWASSYGLDLMQPVGTDLRSAGFATWNIEYRRLGDGGGWPTTFEDVAAAYDLLPGLRELASPIAEGLPVLAVGHSAGGQLAAWAASRTPGTPGGRPSLIAEHTFSLAGVLDLSDAARTRVGGAAAIELLGGSPEEVPERYRKVDPALLDPERPVTAVVGTQDPLVPASQATSYLAHHPLPEVDRLEVPGNHFALIDPASAAWRRVRSALGAAADRVRGPEDQ